MSDKREKKLQYMRDYYQKNKEAVKEKSKANVRKRRAAEDTTLYEKERRYSRAYYQQHREEILEKKKDRKRDKERAAEYQRQYRAKKREGKEVRPRNPVESEADRADRKKKAYQKWYQKNKAKKIAYNAAYERKVKEKVREAAPVKRQQTVYPTKEIDMSKHRYERIDKKTWKLVPIEGANIAV